MGIKLNLEYDVLTPDGFKPFVGVSKIRQYVNHIHFDNGISISVTDDHQFMQGNIRFPAKDISVGDGYEFDDGFSLVTKVEISKTPVDVYDLLNVGGGNKYITNGLVSHNCAFNGSGDNVFSDAVRKKQREENVREAEVKEKGGTIHIWEPPNPDHKYIAGLDVSRGDSEDYSACVIIDYDTWEQVFEYKGKMPPDLLADFVMKYVRPYNAYLGIDITGGMGVATSRKLAELGYPKKLMYYEHKDPTDPTVKIDESDIAGINFAAKNNRVQIIEAHENAVRNGFKIRSERWVTEMDTYVYINGKPDHQQGEHDDLIMGGGMCLFLANTAFKRLQKSGDVGKAMARNWKSYTNVGNRNGGSIVNMNTSPSDLHRQQMAMQSGEVSVFNYASSRLVDNRWLFGVSPKDVELLTIYRNVGGNIDNVINESKLNERQVRARLAKYGIR